MNHSSYQRFVLGYHGCDASVADDAINRGTFLKESENNYDWLGKGIYFWEHGPDRALEWAHQKQKEGKIKEPAVVGALIQLGKCFDLLDTRHTSILPGAFKDFQTFLEAAGTTAPENSSDKDQLRRNRDCALLNWLMRRFEKSDETFQTIRGVFQEGDLAFDGSGIRIKSHIQIAIRDPSCILGFFRPV